jgi:hypothetical protein
VSLPILRDAAIDDRVRCAAQYYAEAEHQWAIGIDMTESTVIGDVVRLMGRDGMAVAYVRVRQANGGFRCSWTRRPS